MIKGKILYIPKIMEMFIVGMELTYDYLGIGMLSKNKCYIHEKEK